MKEDVYSYDGRIVTTTITVIYTTNCCGEREREREREREATETAKCVAGIELGEGNSIFLTKAQAIFPSPLFEHI